MKKAAVTILAVLVLGSVLAAPGRAAAQSPTGESLFREAKLLVFDKSWEEALDKLEELIDRFPESSLAGQALFYKGECLGALRGRQREALRAYKAYIRLEEAKPSLVEESEGSIVDLAFDLYEAGDASALREIEDRLDHENKVVRYYAAYKMSLVPDKKLAAKAAPVLSRIIETEKDKELLDRARIALMRVSPESLRSAEDRQPRTTVQTARTLHLRIRAAGRKEPVFSLNIPFALADLALSALDEEDKAALRKKGYDVNRIINDVAKSKDSLLRIVGEDGTVFEIWID
jgi:tetratricopeptide (TPR) repeat protein